MKIKTRIYGVVNTNCYFITNEETRETVIIDPPDKGNEIIDFLEEGQLIPVAILLTHGHFDHIMAVNDLKNRYEIPAYLSECERELISNATMNAAAMAGFNETLEPDIFLSDGEVLILAGYKITVIHTPGHTIGSSCYYIEEENVLFSGDTLFFETIGRTDLATGSMEMIYNSIKNKLFVLPEETKVYPGHGKSTSIQYEKAENPYFNEESW